MKKSRRVVVVGAVAAGMSAASQVRRRQPGTRVVVFERGDRISYGACGMPYNIADPGRSLDDLVVLTPEQAREQRGIELHLRHEVIAINHEQGLVRVRDLESNDERHEPFDALILACGARATRLGLEGFELKGVFALRDLDDGARIKQHLSTQATRAVIVGGGYIGLEMAHVLRERGLEVVIVEAQPQILPGWSPDTVALVSETLASHEVEVVTSTTTHGATVDDQGRLSGIQTDRGHFAGDLVLEAVGIRPNVSVAAAGGLRIGESGAIWVNQYQQTSVPTIWAAGDCCEAYHRILRKNVWLPLGTTANKQGRVAGANAAGENLRFRGVVGTAGFVVFDLEVARSGLSAEQASDEGFDPVEVTVRQRSRGHAFPGGTTIQVTLVADQPTGLVLGCEIAGRDGAALRINTIAAALAAHMTVADLQGLDLVYAPPFAPVWDPLLVAANQLIKKVKGGKS